MLYLGNGSYCLKYQNTNLHLSLHTNTDWLSCLIFWKAAPKHLFPHSCFTVGMIFLRCHSSLFFSTNTARNVYIQKFYFGLISKLCPSPPMGHLHGIRSDQKWIIWCNWREKSKPHTDCEVWGNDILLNTASLAVK